MRKKRSGHSDSFDRLDTILGALFLSFAGDALTAIDFDKPAGFHASPSPPSGPVKRELAEYFGQKRTSFTCETAFLTGTSFEQEVWTCLREIPYGETRTYKWLAERVGKPDAFRAVGNALGKNPIPIIFPCHRIIESDGSLGGYSGGIDIKRRLLEIEYYTRLAGS